VLVFYSIYFVLIFTHDRKPDRKVKLSNSIYRNEARSIIPQRIIPVIPCRRKKCWRTRNIEWNAPIFTFSLIADFSIVCKEKFCIRAGHPREGATIDGTKAWTMCFFIIVFSHKNHSVFTFSSLIRENDASAARPECPMVANAFFLNSYEYRPLLRSCRYIHTP